MIISKSIEGFWPAVAVFYPMTAERQIRITLEKKILDFQFLWVPVIALYGEAGDDFLIGMGGTDSLNGGAGNDTLLYQAGHIFNGDADWDMIRTISNDTTSLDLSTLTGSSIEQIALDNLNGFSAANTLDVRYQDVVNINATQTLYITGDVGLDTVTGNINQSNDFIGSVLLNGITMDHYSKFGANIYIQQGLLNASGGSSDIINGDAGDNTLTGTTANETLNGYDGHDTLDGNGGTDTLNGGAGDDILLYDSDDILVGGTGTDTMGVRSGDATAVTVNTTNHQSIEVIDLSNGAANTVTLVRSDIIDMSDNDDLYITGDSGIDSVDLSQFNLNKDYVGVVNVGGIDYDHYSKNGADLFVQNDLIML